MSLLIGRRVRPWSALLYVVAQFLGSLCGTTFVWASTPGTLTPVGSLGELVLGPGVSGGQGFLAEVMCTFLLVFTIWGTAVNPHHPETMRADAPSLNFMVAGLVIGLSVFVNILGMGPLSGACMNPARHFGPALLSGTWSNWWAFDLGPLVGASAATLCYLYVLPPPVDASKRRSLSSYFAADAVKEMNYQSLE